jgi:hypothetical protein
MSASTPAGATATAAGTSWSRAMDYAQVSALVANAESLSGAICRVGQHVGTYDAVHRDVQAA